MSTITKERPPQQSGRLEQLAESCRRQLKIDPRNAAALHRLGLLAQETGQPEEAVELLLRSLQINGQNVPAIVDLANVLKEMGRLDEAADFYRAALEAAPRDVDLHVKLGKVLGVAGHWDEAVQSLQEAVKLNPESAFAYGNLGLAYQSRGELALAIASYRQATRLLPGSEQIMANLGGCLVQAGRHEEAIEVLSRGVRKHPRSASAFSNLAAACTALGRTEEATCAAWKAVEISPQSAQALNNLGNALKAQGQYAQAIGCFAKARQNLPDCYIAYNNLGTTLSEMGRSAEALEGLRRACQLNPNNPSVFSNYLLTLNYQPDQSRETVFAEHRQFDAQFAQPLRGFIEPHENVAEPQRRLRIGYVSADFRDHPVAQFVEPVLATHSASDCDVFCYANQRVNDAVTDRLRRQVPQWRNVASLTDVEFVAQILRDRIDILVDLSGHTAGNRLLVFARKPAPIQVTMIGYMQTTGLSTIDYRITDEHLDPVGVSDPFNTETLIRLPSGAATFQPPAVCPPVNELPALGNGYVTYASFNNLAKVSAEVVAAWARILQAQPNAKLLLVGRGGNSLVEAFASHGIDSERLEVLERLPFGDYLALHHRVDFLLDTFPYNGGTTSLLALWMGVPLVTLAGAGAVSRTGAGILQGVGLSRLAASNVDEYIARAVGQTRDLPGLADLRASLRSKLLSALESPAIFVGQLERTYREMWVNWCADSATTAH